jgi:hypothetical protein
MPFAVTSTASTLDAIDCGVYRRTRIDSTPAAAPWQRSPRGGGVRRIEVAESDADTQSQAFGSQASTMMPASSPSCTAPAGRNSMLPRDPWRRETAPLRRSLRATIVRVLSWITVTRVQESAATLDPLGLASERGRGAIVRRRTGARPCKPTPWGLKDIGRTRATPCLLVDASRRRRQSPPAWELVRRFF